MTCYRGVIRLSFLPRPVVLFAWPTGADIDLREVNLFIHTGCSVN